MPALILAVAAGLAGIALAGCGSGGPGKLHSGVVAEVGNVAISEAELNHLISLEATFAQKKSGINVTKPLILDPPDYSACIADLQSVTQSQTTAKHAVKANTLDTSALKSECQTNYEQLERGKLEYLIFTDWVLGEANRLGLKASSAEVERQMEATKQGFEKHPDGYQKFLQESGMTNADLLRQITFSQLESELSRKISSEETAKKTPAPPVPHAQIASYYKRNISKYEHPEGRVVQLLVTETRSAAQKAKSEIQSGKSFASVDKRVSMDPDPYTKEHGGEFGELEQGELEAEKVTMPGVFSSSDAKTLAKAIFSAREGALEGPVNTHDASYVLEVKHITGRKPTETLTQVEGEIRLRLAENQPQTQPSFGQLLEKHWRAQTNCAKSLVVSYCEQYKALKQETPAEALKVEKAQREGTEKIEKRQVEKQISLSSAGISAGTRLQRMDNRVPKLDSRYTCDGQSISLPMNWNRVPPGTAEIMLGVNEAGVRESNSTIWMLAGIHPNARSIATGEVPPGAVLARNNTGKTGWAGICPPRGGEYQYEFVIYALDKKLRLKSGFKPTSITSELRRDIVGSGLMIANYKRR